MTADGICYQVARLLGILRPGQGANTDTVADLFTGLNQMIDGWNAERLMIPSMTRTEFALVAGQEDYTLGPSGADWTLSRPSRVDSASLLSSAGAATEMPFDGLLTIDEYRIGKSGVYVNMTYPRIQITVRPAPAAGQYLAIYTWASLAQFADGTTSYTLPPGYEEAIKFNLAHQMAPSYKITSKAGVDLNSIEKRARETKGRIKSANLQANILQSEPAGHGGVRNILTWQ